METYAANVLAEAQAVYGNAPALSYALMAIGTALLGNLVAIPAMLLGFDGVLGDRGFYGAPIAVLAGHLVGDVTWYTLGRLLSGTRFGVWIQKKLPEHARVTRFFAEGRISLLAVSKLLATPTVPILFLLGWYRTPPGRYAYLSLVSAGIWLGGSLAFCILVYSGLRIVF